MKIYIDEAGAFIPPPGKRKFSLVLALVVPAATEAALFYEFLGCATLGRKKASRSRAASSTRSRQLRS